MGFLKNIFGSLIRSLFDFTGVYSTSIILMTIIFNICMLPLVVKQIKSTANMQKIQPQAKALQEKYKNDKETLNRKTMELYKENKVNPFSGCLPLLIQMPIIWALFGVLREPMVYVFADAPKIGAEAIAQSFLWIKDLSQPDQLSTILNFDFAAFLPGILPIITAVLTYVQVQISTPSNVSSQNNSMSSMKFIMPMMILVFSRNLSAGLILYWVTGTLFRIVQQLIMQKLDQRKEQKA